MSLSSRSLHCIGTFKVAESASSFNDRIKNRWRRRFCHRVPAGCFEGLSDVNAFVSGDSHVGDAMNAKYGHQQGYNGGFLKPEVVQNQQFRPWRPSPPRFRAGPPPKSADHRNWIFAASQPTPDCERFKVLSYNILADYLAWEHQSNLYFHIPSHILAWEWRKRRLFIEFGLWSPDIMCLQEVDKFPDLEVELAIRGYAGIWKIRTGNATDGCAIFWRTNRFQLKHEEHIEFNKLGLRNNVAQLCVFESNLGNRCGNATLLARDNTPTGANQVVVCNTHVLYNPKRGEIKLGQVRTLLDRAFAISRAWNDAPVIVCGDFNSVPMSPLYKFIATQKLNLAGLARDQISGQSSCTESRWPNSGNGPYRPQASGRCANESFSNAQQNYFKTQEKVQSDIGSASPIEESVVTLYADIEQESNEQISSNITMKLEAENAGHQAEVSLTYPLPANLSSRTFEICSQQSNILVNRDAVKNNEEAQKNILYEASSGRHTISPVSGDSADEIKLTSTLCMDNSATSCSRSNGTFQSYLTDNNNFGNAAFYHGSRVDFSSMSEKIDALPKEKPSASSETSIVPIVDAAAKQSSAVSVVEENAGSLITSHNSGKADGLDTCIFDGLIVHVSDRMGVAYCIEAETLVDNMNSGRDGKNFASGNILQENPAHCDNLSTDVTLTKNCQFSEQSCIKVNEENQSSELNGLEENADTNFFKELLGMEDDDQTTKDFNLPNLELREVSAYHPAGCVSKVARHLVKPFCWSPMEIEIASGKQNCTVVEHPLKLRSVYSDVEDYAGTKDSNREPRITSYNQKFMGTVDYIWCSEDLQTVKVLDTIPKHILQRTPGFPTQKWGSDHIALACELAFPKGYQCK